MSKLKDHLLGSDAEFYAAWIGVVTTVVAAALSQVKSDGARIALDIFVFLVILDFAWLVYVRTNLLKKVIEDATKALKDLRSQGAEIHLYDTTDAFYRAMMGQVATMRSEFEAVNFIPDRKSNKPHGRDEYHDLLRKKIMENGGKMTFRRLWGIEHGEKLDKVKENCEELKACDNYHVRCVISPEMATLPCATIVVIDAFDVFVGFLWKDPSSAFKSYNLHIRSKDAGEAFHQYVEKLWQAEVTYRVKEGPDYDGKRIDAIREKLPEDLRSSKVTSESPGRDGTGDRSVYAA